MRTYLIVLVIWLALTFWDQPNDGISIFIAVVLNGIIAILLTRALGLLYLLYLLSRRGSR